MMSSIQLNDVVFTRNSIKRNLLFILSNCSAIIQNNVVFENNLSISYTLFETSTIQLNGLAFIQNNVKENLLHVESYCSATVKNNMIIENNMYGQVFDVDASNLRIDTISFYNNTLMEYLMFAISSSNIGLNFMRIRENRFKAGIILIKNCIGRLADTYIENYDHYSRSAISVFCANKGQKCFSFEFTNNTIIWNSKLLFPVRPILELTGTIIISNVNVSVSSLREIEVMRYSTKDVIRQYPVYKVYCNDYNISASFITCKRANVKHMAKFETFTCIPCVQGTYMPGNGSVKM